MQLKEMGGVLQQYVEVAALGTAGTDGSLPVWQAPNKCQIVSVSLVPAAAITADGTNFSTLTLTRYTAGGTATTVATRAWSATDSVAHTPEAMTLSGTAANLILAADDTLDLVKTHGGTGLALPVMGVVIRYKNYGV